MRRTAGQAIRMPLLSTNLHSALTSLKQKPKLTYQSPRRALHVVWFVCGVSVMFMIIVLETH